MGFARLRTRAACDALHHPGRRLLRVGPHASPRQPYAIGPAEEGSLLAMAGIWSATRHTAPTVAILTTAPTSSCPSSTTGCR